MEKKLTNSGPLREPADKHSIYPLRLRAIAQDIGQWRPVGLTDREIAGRLEVSRHDVKNQKRAKFAPLPDTAQVREIMADIAVKLGLTLTEERVSALLRQPG